MLAKDKLILLAIITAMLLIMILFAMAVAMSSGEEYKEGISVVSTEKTDRGALYYFSFFSYMDLKDYSKKTCYDKADYAKYSKSAMNHCKYTVETISKMIDRKGRRACYRLIEIAPHCVVQTKQGDL